MVGPPVADEKTWVAFSATTATCGVTEFTLRKIKAMHLSGDRAEVKWGIKYERLKTKTL